MEVHRELGKGHDEIIYKDALKLNANEINCHSRENGNMKSNIKELFFRISIIRISSCSTKFFLKAKRANGCVKLISNKF